MTTKAIFLSYASQDAEAARRICDALSAFGLEVWFDRSELRGGDAWDASIRKQIRECALFVPVISANTEMREEGYFRREWNLAVSRTLDMADDKAFLVPVVIDATLDANARVPEKFRAMQWTHLPAGETSVEFAARVRRLLAGEVARPSPAGVRSLASAGTMPGAASVPEPNSIAVLPFANLSRDEDNEYFADGLAEELLNVLAKIRGLRVAARSSAFTFKGKGATVAAVGAALNVATVLEGSVRKSGNRLRISVQLVKVVDGYQLWAETYDRTQDDIFAVQDDIAQSVVKELRTTLLGEVADARAGRSATADVAAAVKGRSTDPEAYRHFLRARHFIDRMTTEDIAKGIGYLKEALALSPGFALAWAELGRAYANEANWSWVPVGEGYGRARDAVTRALAIEPDLAEGHAAMGWIQLAHDWDWCGAEASYSRALAFAPGNAVVLHQASMLAGCMGRLDEALRLGRGAVEQDPLSASAYFFFGTLLMAADRIGEAVAALEKAVEIAPQRAITHATLATALQMAGRTGEALATAMREPEGWARLYALGIIHGTAGHRAEAEAATRELTAKCATDSAYQIAEVHAMCGDADLAFEWLERAYAQRDPGMVWLLADPFLRTLHSDPRWGEFLRKMRFAE